MAHWDEVLPGRVLKVQYKDVVNTASADQVRSPLYADAVDYWQHYETHLDELKEILGPVLEEHSQR